MSPLDAVATAIAAEIVVKEMYAKEWDPKAIARAALTALRDNGVTEGMNEAYMDKTGGEPLDSGGFRAMLDAALTEPES